MRDLVAGHAAPGDQEVVDALRDEDPVGHLEVAARGRQDERAVAVQELGEDADRVVEARLVAHVVPGEVVAADDLAGVARAEGHAEGAQPGVLEAGGEAPERLDGHERLPASLDLGARQVAHVGAVVAPHHHHVE